jgi:hypothetical protein
MHVNALLLMLWIARGQQAQARYPQTPPTHFSYSVVLPLNGSFVMFLALCLKSSLLR